ncbi:Uncharacterized protein TCM_032325 [Theobroma cacao]|uniref:Uncharacterized protein n=1 Tax=Theobroma cacao TaxID=3641 RepID=A0A061F8P7_THECC|nr:Uncharacterized protein TCM_032325 [Theobroma cacao]
MGFDSKAVSSVRVGNWHGLELLCTIFLFFLQQEVMMILLVIWQACTVPCGSI